MAETWPASLPTSLVLGFTEGNPKNVAQFEPMVGAPLLYHVGDQRSRMVSGRWRISNAQRATFRTWYEQTLRMGARRFELTSDSFDGGTWLCQFAHPESYTLEGAAGGWWLTVSIMLVRQLA